MLRIQPDEGISLCIGAKAPAPGVRISTVDMDFAYRRSFERSGGDAYEHLLLDCMLGDPTSFVRWDEVEAAWELIDRIEERWAVGCPPLAYYRPVPGDLLRLMRCLPGTVAAGTSPDPRAGRGQLG